MHHSPSHNNAPCGILNIYREPAIYSLLPLQLRTTSPHIVQWIMLYASNGYHISLYHLVAIVVCLYQLRLPMPWFSYVSSFLCAFDPEYKTLTIAITIVKEKHKLSYFQREIMLNLSGIYFHILHCTIIENYSSSISMA